MTSAVFAHLYTLLCIANTVNTAMCNILYAENDEQHQPELKHQLILTKDTESHFARPQKPRPPAFALDFLGVHTFTTEKQQKHSARFCAH